VIVAVVVVIVVGEPNYFKTGRKKSTVNSSTITPPPLITSHFPPPIHEKRGKAMGLRGEEGPGGTKTPTPNHLQKFHTGIRKKRIKKRIAAASHLSPVPHPSYYSFSHRTPLGS